MQTALHTKAKSSPDYRFYALYDKIYRRDVLAFAYTVVVPTGAPGVDGQSFADIETYGRALAGRTGGRAQEGDVSTPRSDACTSLNRMAS